MQERMVREKTEQLMFKSGKVQRMQQKAKVLEDQRKVKTPFHVSDHQSKNKNDKREGDPMANFQKKRKSYTHYFFA